MRQRVLPLLLALAPVAAAAGDCPPPPDHGAALSALVEQAQQAGSEAEGRRVTNAMWALWAEAPDARAQEMLDRGLRARAALDFETAVAAFDALVAYCPDYAEGYNQRAFVNFLRRDHGAALDDLERAVALDPDHLAARAGLALTLQALGRIKAGQAMLREALRQNPWLPERRMLIETPDDEL